MEVLNSDKYITINVQNRFKNDRNCYVRKWYIHELDLLISNSYDRHNLDRNVLLYHSDLYISDKDIFLYFYKETRYNLRKLFVIPLRYYLDNRYVTFDITGITSLNSSEIYLPIIKYGDKQLYIESMYNSQRYICFPLTYSDFKYCKVARNIRLDVNETPLIEPTFNYGEISLFVDIGYTSQRYIQYCFSKEDYRDIHIQIRREFSVNETPLDMGMTNYTEIPIYLVGLSNSYRNIYLELGRIFTDKYIKLVPYDTLYNDKNCEINVLRGLSINETDLHMTFLDWSNRFIHAPWIVYNSEKKMFLPTSIQHTYLARTPLDIAINVKDLDKVIDGMFHTGIDSILIKDENNNILLHVDEDDYEQGLVRTKIKNVFGEGEIGRNIKRLKFEIFTSQGKQLDGLERKLLFSGKVFGQVIK